MNSCIDFMKYRSVPVFPISFLKPYKCYVFRATSYFRNLFNTATPPPATAIEIAAVVVLTPRIEAAQYDSLPMLN